VARPVVVGRAMPGLAPLFGRGKQSTFAAQAGPPARFQPSGQDFGLKSFSFFLFNSIQVQTLEIHIYLNICPKIMKSILLFF
jgi:hypothetical protein